MSYVLELGGSGVGILPEVEDWAAMISKVYEVDPFLFSKCGVMIIVVAFITDNAAVDRIINHLKLVFVAEKPPPPHVFKQVALMAAEERAEPKSNFLSLPELSMENFDRSSSHFLDRSSLDHVPGSRGCRTAPAQIELRHQ